MAQQHIQLQQFIAAPRPAVFRYFADHQRFGRLWWPARCKVIKLAEGDEPMGVGSVRQLRVFGVRFQETITGFHPDEGIEYRVTRGGPFKNHVGEMRFCDVPGGTQLDHRIEFDSRWPMVGHLAASILHAAWLRNVAGVVDRLVSPKR